MCCHVACKEVLLSKMSKDILIRSSTVFGVCLMKCDAGRADEDKHDALLPPVRTTETYVSLLLCHLCLLSQIIFF